jgi:hypothetical protein
MRYKIALRKTDEGDSVSVPGCRAVGRKVLTDLDGAKHGQRACD